MEEVTDLVLEFGGSLSGEHGDGLVRSEWNRKMFGPVVYEAFRRVKRGVRPGQRAQPRQGGGRARRWRRTCACRPARPPPDPPTVFDYSKQGGFFRSVELCNGAGVCRKTQGGAMCPSYRATQDERDTTRGRANALRLALASGGAAATPPGEPPRGRSAQRWVARGDGPVPVVQGVQEPSARATWTWPS